MKFNNSTEEGTFVVTTASELEAAFRIVIKEVISEQPVSKKCERITRVAAAKRLGKDLSTLNRWARVGKIHPIRVGASVFFSLEEIEAIEEGRL